VSVSNRSGGVGGWGYTGDAQPSYLCTVYFVTNEVGTQRVGLDYTGVCIY